MSGIDPLNSSDHSVNGLLPVGTVTLLLADVEGSTGLWQTRPEEMSAAVEKLDRTLADLVGAHDGVRPVEQGEGDSFVVAFTRASDAVACALALQRAPLAPLQLRIGLHTGEVQLRDKNNYSGPTINRTARLRDVAHGGQTVLSGATEELVVDRLPADAWLTDLGTHHLRDLPRPERVVQLCHPDLRNDFPPLRTRETVVAQHLPVQFTSFVGREVEMNDLRQILADNRLVTLTGAGGVGKTRLGVQVAAQMVGEFGDGVWYVDLAPITDPDLVPVAVIRALGLPDQPGRSTMDTLLRFVGDRRMLLVLDNCEHLLDACAALVIAVLGGCPAVRLVATTTPRIRPPSRSRRSRSTTAPVPQGGGQDRRRRRRATRVLSRYPAEHWIHLAHDPNRCTVYDRRASKSLVAIGYLDQRQRQSWPHYLTGCRALVAESGRDLRKVDRALFKANGQPSLPDDQQNLSALPPEHNRLSCVGVNDGSVMPIV